MISSAVTVDRRVPAVWRRGRESCLFIRTALTIKHTDPFSLTRGSISWQPLVSPYGEPWVLAVVATLMNARVLYGYPFLQPDGA